jgi:uncharacterized protein YjbI with pentapeptide repeats
VADREHGRPAPATTTRVVGEDWYGLDLSGRTGSQVHYSDLDLTETTSDAGLTFEECVFYDSRFNASVHTGAAFVNCAFTGCSFFGARFVECKLVGSRFDRCTFNQLVVERGDWSFTGLHGADLHTASLTDVRMREADLTAARCDGATVVGVDLSGAWLDKVNFERCDLRRSDLSTLDPATVNLRGAIIGWEQAIVLVTAMGLDVRPDSDIAPPDRSRRRSPSR